MLDTDERTGLESAWEDEDATVLTVCDDCCSGKPMGAMLATAGHVEGLYVLSFPMRAKAEACGSSKALIRVLPKGLCVIHRMAAC